ncbi:hypothetical protein ON010_g10787 [Phytophthora cinnamomi]|nr:hypothetical protein ON010_g10787 [Phytophthora cinnamomi]
MTRPFYFPAPTEIITLADGAAHVAADLGQPPRTSQFPSQRAIRSNHDRDNEDDTDRSDGLRGRPRVPASDAEAAEAHPARLRHRGGSKGRRGRGAARRGAAARHAAAPAAGPRGAPPLEHEPVRRLPQQRRPRRDQRDPRRRGQGGALRARGVS